MFGLSIVAQRAFARPAVSHRGYVVRRSSRLVEPYRDQELRWLAAKSGFDRAFGLPFDKLRTSLNRGFGSQTRNSCY